MTQVTNLNAGMRMQGQTKVASKQEKQKDLMSEFAGIMSQNAQGFQKSSYTNGLADERVLAGNTKNTLTEKFDTFGSRRISQAQTDGTDKTAVSENIRKLAGDVKEAIQKTMDVSDEELEQAMEELGLDAAGLLQTQNLIRLVQQLTGNTDVSALLTDAGFQTTMQEVNRLITDFQQVNGLNGEQFLDLLGQLSAQIDEMEETVKELLGADVQQTEQLTASPENAQEHPSEAVPETVQNVWTAGQQKVSDQAAEADTHHTSEQVAEPSAVVEKTGTAEGFSQTSDQDEGLMQQNDKNKLFQMEQTDRSGTLAEQHAGIYQANPTATGGQIQAAGAELVQTPGYVELEQLMDQLEGLARTFASSEGTTVEMQLNPESLGRLVLTVTEKHGNVTAQIAASNEQVKEALQTQMVELRSTLQAQGIKVEAVEVTVATHEFEQNLDGNTSANGQMQEQARRENERAAGGRRNLDRSSLDELSGLMSEEETLVAQMMRDNGGSVDYTA